ncbi:unnamed protein product [Parnassius apollo]|uniref:(apollo) hypothetical protein n=1 Tax=Parnassius apollo TaxID=110799 RepID=A0A8S3Y441_PARAO|nr:unnamed protein product [Parnassius apollo]
MRCCSSGLSNACGVLHQRRVLIAGPAKTLPTPSQLVGMMDARGCWVVVQHRMLPRPAPAPDAPWRPPGSGPLRVLPYSIIHSGGRHLAGDAQTRRRFMVRPCAQAGLCTFNFCRGTALTPLGKVLTDCADVAVLSHNRYVSGRWGRHFPTP